MSLVIQLPHVLYAKSIHLEEMKVNICHVSCKTICDECL